MKKSTTDITRMACGMAGFSETDTRKALRGTPYHYVRDRVKEHGFLTSGATVPENEARLIALATCLYLKRRPGRDAPSQKPARPAEETVETPSGSKVTLRSRDVDAEMRALRSDALFKMLSEGRPLSLKGFDEKRYRDDVARLLAMDIEDTTQTAELEDGIGAAIDKANDELLRASLAEGADAQAGIYRDDESHAIDTEISNLEHDMELLHMPGLDSRYEELKSRLLDLSRYVSKHTS